MDRSSASQPSDTRAAAGSQATPSQREINALVERSSRGQYAEALSLASAMTSAFPSFGFGWKALATVLTQMGRVDEALMPMRKAAAIVPGDVDAHYNLGVIEQSLGLVDECVASYRRALEIEPSHARAHNNLATSLIGMGLLQEAEAHIRKALGVDPDFVEAHSNLGSALHDQGRIAEAEACYRHVLRIKPDLAEAHFNIGSLVEHMGRRAEAEASFLRALELKPSHIRARLALLMQTLLIAPTTASEAASVPVAFARRLRELEDYLASAPHSAPDMLDSIHLHLPMHLAYRDGNHVDSLSRYGNLAAGHVDAGSAQRITPSLTRRKLRLAVVSCHFRRHSVWDINLRGLLVHLDRRKIEVLLYHVGQLEDAETALAKSLADVWRDGHTVHGYNGWLEAIAGDQPDVVFYPEIGMDQLTYRLASHRLAPLQVTSWGHPITTGLPSIDVYFSGELLEPPDADAHYRERLVRLPGAGCCTWPMALIPEALPALEAELALRPGTRFVLAQRPFKFDPADDALYAQIAAAVGDCTFILLRDNEFPWATDIVLERLRIAFREYGLEPDRHLLVIAWLPLANFLTLLDLCDVYLDCPAFSGYTTAVQAVRRGIPVLTREGKYLRQRLAAGLLRKIGVTDTIAACADDYLAIAIRLAEECKDPLRRAARRETIRSAAPRMDDDLGVVRAFEDTLLEAIEGLAPPTPEEARQPAVAPHLGPQQRYIELMKSSLLNEPYLENEVRLLYIFAMLGTKQSVDQEIVRDIGRRLPTWVDWVKTIRQEGRAWGAVPVQDGEGATRMLDLRRVCDFAQTAVGRKRLDSLSLCLDAVRTEKVPGDLLETQVWRGGTAILMRAYLAAWEMGDRKVWLADDFAGSPLPPSVAVDRGGDVGAVMAALPAIPLEEVQESFRRYKLLDDQVRFLKGSRRDTLSSAAIDQLALLRLGGDFCASNMDALEVLYGKVSPGGFIIIDGYGESAACRRALAEFQVRNKDSSPLEQIDSTGVYWRKSG